MPQAHAPWVPDTPLHWWPAAGNAPSVPDQVTALQISAGDGQLTLSWDVPDMNLSPFVSYRVERSVAGGSFAPIATPAGTSYTDTAVTNDVTYTYRVFATNGLGDGPASTFVAATPTAPSFQPTDLAQLYAWYDFTDPGTVFTNAARTTSVLGNGDQVQGVLDKSTNGYHITSPATSNTWDAVNSQVNISGLTNCFFVTDAAASITDTQADMEIFFTVKTSDTVYMLFASEDGGRFSLYANDGSGDLGYSNLNGSTFFADGVDIGADNQNALHDAWSTGTGRVASATNMDVLSIAQSSGKLKFFGWIVDGFHFEGAVTHVVITQSLSAGDRANLLNWLSTEVPS